MKEFDIGHVPKGWKRGEPLSVRQGAIGGAVMRQNIRPFNSRSAHEVTLTFVNTDAERVNAWLKWWSSK